VKVTRAVVVFGVLLYLFLWVLVLNGADQLVEPLVIPVVLVALVLAGLALDRYLGIIPRKQHFHEPDDKTEQ
jgi:hypothetical protein